MHLVSKDLLVFGYKPSDLATFLPHTVKEVDERVKELESKRAIQVVASRDKNSNNRRIA